jgi:hypothetical protein
MFPVFEAPASTPPYFFIVNVFYWFPRRDGVSAALKKSSNLAQTLSARSCCTQWPAPSTKHGGAIRVKTVSLMR